jgi:hypothetical protein
MKILKKMTIRGSRLPLDLDPQTMLGGQSSGINKFLFVETIADRDGIQEAGEAPKRFV